MSKSGQKADKPYASLRVRRPDLPKQKWYDLAERQWPVSALADVFGFEDPLKMLRK